MSWTKWYGDRLERQTEKAMSEALVKAGEATLGISNQQVPLDEGTLQESGIVKVNPNNRLDVVISYGGGPGTGFPRIPYAKKWHETPANFQHGRKHNYLRDPVNTFTPGALKKEMQKAGKKVWS